MLSLDGDHEESRRLLWEMEEEREKLAEECGEPRGSELSLRGESLPRAPGWGGSSRSSMTP